MKQQPAVRPVKRYRDPDYPSWEDPNPIEHPTPVPYPASEKLLKAVASLGLAAGLGQGTLGAGEAMSNPFALSHSGLPHRSSPYGTGAPQRVDMELAVRVAKRVFSEEGYNLQPAVPFKKNGSAFVVDEYDKAKKVGFVFANYGNLDRDAYIRWDLRGKEDDIEKLLDSLLRYGPNTPEFHGLQSAYAQATKLDDPERRQQEMKAILSKYEDLRLSLDEIKDLNAGAEEGESFIALISQYDQRFVYHPGGDYYEELRKARAIPDPAKRKIATEAVQEKAAREVIERLEKAVKEYIAWARANGAQ